MTSRRSRLVAAGVGAGLLLALASWVDAQGKPPAGPASSDVAAAPDSGHIPEARPTPTGAQRRALAELLAFENAVRAETDFAALPTWRELSGPDPYAVLGLASGGSSASHARAGSPFAYVGILRGADAVVLLDDHARERARAAAPAGPTGLIVTDAGEILVSGELSSDVARFTVTTSGLDRVGTLRVRDALGVRDIALAHRTLYAADRPSGRIVALDLDAQPSEAREVDRCRGALQVRVVAGWLVANCLLDHALVLHPLAASGRVSGPPVRIVHDGPFWSFDAIDDGHGGLLLAAGGVEDHPLDRRGGTFGNIDSFVYLYRLGKRVAAVNVGALGVVTPKWVEISRTEARGVAGGGAIDVRTAGYGSDGLLELRWSEAALDAVASGKGRSDEKGSHVRPEVRARPLPPGTTSVARCGRGTDACSSIAANPLLDAWVRVAATDASGDDAARTAIVPAAGDASRARRARSPESRLGELLFFTTLLSPWASSEGKLSRFTCETCHHEGYVDGRTHFTGRGDVHATTKPLLSLLGNRPYFSRALDPSMARMVDNEFRVASRGSGRDPWFELETAERPWVASIDGLPDRLSPVLLRRSLMRFLMDFNHAPNPWVRGRRAMSARERSGAEIFRDRCESCHSARLLADDPDSRVPYERWEELVLGSGAIVWGRDGYEKTGVEPYVHARGARTPSLRRLYVKRPYFTSGSAATLDDVLARVILPSGTPGGNAFAHAGSGQGAHLSEEQRAALLAFLRLL